MEVIAKTPNTPCEGSSKITTLSDDVLLEIFYIASRSSPFLDRSSPAPLDYSSLAVHPLPFPMVVSTICHRWRRLAVEYPLLWTEIHIPGSPEYNIGLFFHRSQPAEIDVTLDNVDFFYRDSYPDISQLLKASLNRLRSFYGRFATVQEIHKLFETLREDAAPVLQKMEIILYFKEETDNLSDIPPNSPILNEIPCLHFLRIQGIPLDCLPCIVNLTHLDIREFCPTSKEFEELFGACPNLISLVLCSFGYCSSENNDESLVIEAPKLQNLAISFDNSHLSVACACPITYMSTPNLKYLEVSGPYSASSSLSTHLSRVVNSWTDPSSCTLRLNKTTLLDCLPFLQGLHRLTNLEITSVNSEVLPQVLSMPNFKSISLDLNTIPTPTWGDIFSHLVAVSSPVLLHVPASSSSDPQIAKALSIHKNISITNSACREVMITEDNDDDYEEDLDFYDEFDVFQGFDSDYDDYDGYPDYDEDEYDDFEDNGLEGVVSYNGPI